VPDNKGGHWCGIGIERNKRGVNLGTLFRSAVCLHADFVFTIGRRYDPHCSDTVRSWTHLPYVPYDDVESFRNARPFDTPVIGVELAPDAKPLETFVHPRRALYLLGPEDGSLSNAALDMCTDVVAFSSAYCLNVASAGTVVLYDRHAKLSAKRLEMILR
jgi:tRNA G18 (ribose-2'-O)-methylase SpoU